MGQASLSWYHVHMLSVEHSRKPAVKDLSNLYDGGSTFIPDFQPAEIHNRGASTNAQAFPRIWQPLSRPFTDFPFEIRLKVYKYALPEEIQPVIVASRAAKIAFEKTAQELEDNKAKSRARKKNEGRKRARARVKEQPKPELNVMLLQATRQIQEEASSIYYKLNHFHFVMPKEMFTWLERLNAEQTNQICRISCHLKATVHSLKAVELLETCKGLKDLRVTADVEEIMKRVDPSSVLPPRTGMWQAQEVRLDTIMPRHKDTFLGRKMVDPSWMDILDHDECKQRASQTALEAIATLIFQQSKRNSLQGCGLHDAKDLVKLHIEKWRTILSAAVLPQNPVKIFLTECY